MSKANKQGPGRYYRTPEHRRLMGKLVRRWKPWEKSPGPTTPDGKAKVARYPDKGGTRHLLRELGRALREQAEAMKRIG